jgi:C4-dicarboxylate transporter DctM subunit
MVFFMVVLGLMLLMIIGVPVAVSMGMTAIVALFCQGKETILTMVAQRMFAGTTGFTLLAVPFFILAGVLMNTGGITERIFNFALALTGHCWGGLGQVNILSSLIFSGMSGTAVGDAAGFGLIEIKAMNDAGYEKPFSAAITAASSTIGPIVPPSVPMVVYASLTCTSVGALFMAGVVPGILMAVALMVAVYFIAKNRHYPRCQRSSFTEIVRSFLRALPALTCPLIIIGGMGSGIFTPTEAGAVACLYALILGVFIYKEIKVKEIPALFWEAVKQAANVLFIIAVAGFFAWFLSYMHIPQMTIEALIALTGNPYILILLMIVIYLILGCFIEGTAIMYMTLPIFLPILARIGMNYVQFGVITVLALMIGMITPPVGVCLYAVAGIAKIDFWTLAKESIPYVFGLIFVLLLVAFVPQVSLWLPSLLGFK